MLVQSKELAVEEVKGVHIESGSRLKEVEDDVEQGDEGLEKGSVVRMGILKEQRNELYVDLRQEEVVEDESEQGNEGNMVKML